MKYRTFCKTKKRNMARGKYTFLYYDRCAEKAKERTENYLMERLIGLIKKMDGTEKADPG